MTRLQFILMDHLQNLKINIYSKATFHIIKKKRCEVSWKYFATSHVKGVVDGIGGSAKSLVRSKARSKGNDAIIVQKSKVLAKAAAHLMPQVNVIHISKEEILKIILLVYAR